MDVKIIKQRRKTISITVSLNNEVIVKAPLYLSDNEVYKFIDNKKGWINSKINKNTNSISKYNDIILKNKCLYMGKIIDFTDNFNKILQTDGKNYLTDRINQISLRLNLSFNGLKFKNYKSRWGQCDKNKIITLNYKLACLDLELIDYVIIHELCHTKYFNHQKEFHQLLKSYFKNELQLKNRLKEMSFVTKI